MKSLKNKHQTYSSTIMRCMHVEVYVYLLGAGKYYQFGGLEQVSTVVTVCIKLRRHRIFSDTGVCGPDGLYYRDENSFVLCSNAKGYIQPCAPGTRNAGLADYEPG